LLQSTAATLLLTTRTRVHVAAPGVLIVGLRRHWQSGEQQSDTYGPGGDDSLTDHYFSRSCLSTAF